MEDLRMELLVELESLYDELQPELDLDKQLLIYEEIRDIEHRLERL